MHQYNAFAAHIGAVDVRALRVSSRDTALHKGFFFLSGQPVPKWKRRRKDFFFHGILLPIGIPARVCL
jgi:hypothetical protein